MGGKIVTPSVTDAILNAKVGRQQYKEIITSPPLSGPGSGVVPANVPGVIEGRPIGPYATDGGVCIDSPPDSWDFQFFTVTFSGVAPQAMVADQFIQLARPVKKIYLVGNNGPTTQAPFIHFVKLGMYNGVTESKIQGNEPWIPFPGGGSWNGVTDAGGGEALTDISYIEFCKPISKFYITIINGGGAGVPVWNLTFLATDDIRTIYSNAK